MSVYVYVSMCVCICVCVGLCYCIFMALGYKYEGLLTTNKPLPKYRQFREGGGSRQRIYYVCRLPDSLLIYELAIALITLSDFKLHAVVKFQAHS